MEIDGIWDAKPGSGSGVPPSMSGPPRRCGPQSGVSIDLFTFRYPQPCGAVNILLLNRTEINIWAPLCMDTCLLLTRLWFCVQWMFALDTVIKPEENNAAWCIFTNISISNYGVSSKPIHTIMSLSSFQYSAVTHYLRNPCVFGCLIATLSLHRVT